MAIQPKVSFCYLIYRFFFRTTAIRSANFILSTSVLTGNFSLPVMFRRILCNFTSNDGNVIFLDRKFRKNAGKHDGTRIG